MITVDWDVFSGKFYFSYQNIILKVRLTFSKNIIKMFINNEANQKDTFSKTEAGDMDTKVQKLYFTIFKH